MKEKSSDLIHMLKKYPDVIEELDTKLAIIPIGGRVLLDEFQDDPGACLRVKSSLEEFRDMLKVTLRKTEKLLLS